MQKFPLHNASFKKLAMIIRFGCSNYKSIYNYQEIVLSASPLKDEQADTISSKGFRDPLLPTIGIYGANASGKTNLLKAINFLIDGIRTSHKTSPEEEAEYPSFFKLIPSSKELPSQFDIDFIHDDQHYHYGFKILKSSIVEEWLYTYLYRKRESKRILFHRNIGEENQFYFGASLKGNNKIIGEITNQSSLFLSQAAQNNHEFLSRIYQYFKNNFVFRFSSDINKYNIADRYKEYGEIQEIVKFLKKLDNGIHSLKVVDEDLTEEDKSFHSKFIDLFNEYLFKDEPIDMPLSKERIELLHEDNNGKLIPFDFDDESAGTKSVIALLVPVFKTIKNGGIFIVDEIESSLHTLLTIKIIELYNRKQTNPNKAQLIFSTHDTNLLCSGILRRDQIWFTEKSKSGQTVIYPLTDFKLRKKYNIESGYLQGRFGAIPFFGDPNKMINT